TATGLTATTSTAGTALTGTLRSALGCAAAGPCVAWAGVAASTGRSTGTTVPTAVNTFGDGYYVDSLTTQATARGPVVGAAATAVDMAAAVPAATATGVAAISAGGYHACAVLRGSRRGVCWGVDSGYGEVSGAPLAAALAGSVASVATGPLRTCVTT